MPPATSSSVRDSGPRLYGMRRISHAYGLTLLAAVLGLPVLAAGLIVSNNCQLRGLECSDRLAFGVVGAIVLAAGVQLLLALHFRLGWTFWLGSVFLMFTAAAQTLVLPAVLILALAPGLAAWITDPPNRRARTLEHWAPRLAAFSAVAVAAPLAGLLLA